MPEICAWRWLWWAWTSGSHLESLAVPRLCSDFVYLQLASHQEIPQYRYWSVQLIFCHFLLWEYAHKTITHKIPSSECHCGPTQVLCHEEVLFLASETLCKEMRVQIPVSVEMLTSQDLRGLKAQEVQTHLFLFRPNVMFLLSRHAWRTSWGCLVRSSSLESFGNFCLNIEGT